MYLEWNCRLPLVFGNPGFEVLHRLQRWYLGVKPHSKTELCTVVNLIWVHTSIVRRGHDFLLQIVLQNYGIITNTLNKQN